MQTLPLSDPNGRNAVSALAEHVQTQALQRSTV